MMKIAKKLQLNLFHNIESSTLLNFVSSSVHIEKGAALTSLIITTISPLKVSTTVEYSNYGFILVIPKKTQRMKTSFEEYNQIQIVGKVKNMP